MSVAADDIRRGSCLCGEVKLVARGAPRAVVACHCASCRRHTGAPFAVFADYEVDKVAFPAGSPRRFRSSPHASRGFCGTCGSTLYYQGDNREDMIHLHIGLFDAPGSFRPDSEDNGSEKLAWIDLSFHG